MGVPAAQALPAQWAGWVKSTPWGTRDSGSHRNAVFQNGGTVRW